jgi:Flp pilus assembly pilin Flp
LALHMVSNSLVRTRGARRGSGLAEHCLFVAAIALIALGIYIKMSGGLHDLWSTANSTLENGSAVSAPATTSTDH